MKPPPHVLRLAMLAVLCVAACNDSDASDPSATGSGGEPWDDGPCVGFDGETLPEGCADWMVEHCATLSREACVELGPSPAANTATNTIGCVLASVVTDSCVASEPLRCIAGIDAADTGTFPILVGSDVLQAVCTADREWCPTELLGGESCGGLPGCGCVSPLSPP